MMAVSNAIRLILLCCLIVVVTPLFISKGDAIPANRERTYPIQEDETRDLRSRKTGETYITSIVEVSPEEARRMHFPGWDKPESRIAPLTNDLERRIAAELKTTLTKREWVINELPGHGKATCYITGQTLLHPIEVTSMVDHGYNMMRFRGSSTNINIQNPWDNAKNYYRFRAFNRNTLFSLHNMGQGCNMGRPKL